MIFSNSLSLPLSLCLCLFLWFDAFSSVARSVMISRDLAFLIYPARKSFILLTIHNPLFLENVYHWSKLKAYERDILYSWKFGLHLINSSRNFLSFISHYVKEILYADTCTNDEIKCCKVEEPFF